MKIYCLFQRLNNLSMQAFLDAFRLMMKAMGWAMLGTAIIFLVPALLFFIAHFTL